jgi:hypothetical protein
MVISIAPVTQSGATTSGSPAFQLGLEMLLLVGIFWLAVRRLAPRRSRSIRTGVGRDRELGSDIEETDARSAILSGTVAAGLQGFVQQQRWSTGLLLAIAFGVVYATTKFLTRAVDILLGLGGIGLAIVATTEREPGSQTRFFAVLGVGLAVSVGALIVAVLVRGLSTTKAPFLLALGGVAQLLVIIAEAAANGWNTTLTFIAALFGALLIGVALLPKFALSVIGLGLLANALAPLATPTGGRGGSTTLFIVSFAAFIVPTLLKRKFART